MQTTTTIAASTYAGFGQRFVAWLIDSIIIGVLQMFVVTPLLAMVGFGVASNLENPDQLTEAEAVGMMGAIFGAMATMWLTAFCILILYYSIMESSKSQASLGKMAMGIKVTDMEGNRLTFGKAFLRSIGKILSAMIMYIGYLMAAFTEKKQGLHDMIASTLVVKK
jgi:uncharacterized RDD family membrane protein YckC